MQVLNGKNARKPCFNGFQGGDAQFWAAVSVIYAYYTFPKWLTFEFSQIYTLHLLSFQITGSRNASHFPQLICCFTHEASHIKI